MPSFILTQMSSVSQYGGLLTFINSKYHLQKYAQSNLDVASGIWAIFLCYSGTILSKIHSTVIFFFYFLMVFWDEKLTL